MILRHISGERHPLLRDEPEWDKLPTTARQFLRRCADATDAVIAYADGKPIAFFRWWDDCGFLVAAGTWVSPKYRRRGIAKRLWLRALDHIGRSHLEVTAISREGSALIKSITPAFEAAGVSVDSEDNF